MSSSSIPLCSHRKADGVLCGSPALRNLDFCYFHEHWRRTHPNRRPQNGAAQPILELPLLEDANAVQLALQQVMQAIITNQLDTRRAGLLLYALQTASANLKRVNFESYKLKDQYNDGDALDYDDYESGDDAEPTPAQSSAVTSEHDSAAVRAPAVETATPVQGQTPTSAEPPANANGNAAVSTAASSVVKRTAATPALSPPRKGPWPEHDKELSDKELIKAVRALAGLT